MDPEITSRPGDLSKLSDEDLVRHYCADPPLREAGEELSRRCLPRIQRMIGVLLFKKGVCPPQRTKTDFFEDAIGRACLKLIKGIYSYRFEASFSTWLSTVVESAVEEERLKVKGRGIEPNPIPEDITVLEEKSATTILTRRWILKSIPLPLTLHCSTSTSSSNRRLSILHG